LESPFVLKTEMAFDEPMPVFWYIYTVLFFIVWKLNYLVIILNQ
jgi:hypothetical protein